MKQLTAGQETERVQFGKAVFWLIEIDLPDKTLFYSNRNSGYVNDDGITISGNQYRARIRNFGQATKTIPAGIDLNDYFGTADAFEFEISSLPEEIDGFHNVIEGYDLEGRVVRLGCVFWPRGGGVVSDDIIWYHTYLIDSYVSSSNAVRIRCVDLSLYLFNRNMMKEVRDADYPLAPTDSYGKTIPQIIGFVKGCPLIPVDVGARSLLDGSALAGDAIISVDSMKDWPAIEPGTDLIIQIDQERIRVREIDSENRTFGTVDTPVERGYGGTVAADHADGSYVYEIQDHYDYIVANHPCHSIENVRIGERLVAADKYEMRVENINEVDIQMLRLLERPEAEELSAGVNVLKIDGERDERGALLWGWDVNDDNTAEDPTSAFDLYENFYFATLRAGQRLSLRMTSDLQQGEAKYGRLKKLRMYIDYFASKRWDDNTYPYFQIIRSGALIGRTNVLQRPSPKDSVIVMGEHDHQEQSDWSIGSSRGLFQVTPETDEVQYDTEHSSGSQNTPPGTWNENFVFTNFNRQDNVHRIQKIVWRVFLDGYPSTLKMRITLKNGKKYELSRTAPGTQVLSGEFLLELQTADVGEILFSDLWNGENNSIKFYCEGRLRSGYWVGLDSRLDVTSEYYIAGQDTDLPQTQIKRRTATQALAAEGSTSRVTQITDITPWVRDLNGWELFNGETDFKMEYNGSDDAEIYIINIWYEIEYQPLTRQIAEGRVSADVRGMFVTQGEQKFLMEHPVDVLTHIMYSWCGVPIEYFDIPTFMSARSTLEAYCPRVSRRVSSQTTAREIIQTLCQDANMRLLFEGTKYYLYIRQEYLDPDMVIAQISEDDYSETNIEMNRVTSEKIANQLAIYFSQNPETGDYRRVIELNDWPSQSQGWGLRRKTYDAKWHGEENQAVTWMGQTMLSWLGWKYAVARITVPISLIHIERGDVVELSHERGNISSQLCEVVMTRISSPGKLQLGLSMWEAKRIYLGDQTKVEVDRGGRWMKFYVDRKLVAILDYRGNMRVRGRVLMGAGQGIATGWSPDPDELFIDAENDGTPGDHHLGIPMRYSTGGWLLPIVFWGHLDRDHYPESSYPEYGIRMYGTAFRVGVPINETISGYVEYSLGVTRIATNGRDVVMKFEQADFGTPEYPGVWTISGIIRSNRL